MDLLKSHIEESLREFGCDLISPQVAYILNYFNDSFPTESEYDEIEDEYYISSWGYDTWTKLGVNPQGLPSLILCQQYHNSESLSSVKYYPIQKINRDWFDSVGEIKLIPSRSLTSLVNSFIVVPVFYR